MEKIGAGLICLAVLFGVCMAFLSQLPTAEYPFSRHPPGSAGDMAIGTLEGNLFITIYSGYFLALVFSRFNQNTLTILMVALGLESLGWWVVIGFQLVLNNPEDLIDWSGCLFSAAYP